jgi:ABC-type dipeptide/oligopeptide/nickel transport system permease component
MLVVTLWVIITITFILMNLAPGSPLNKEGNQPAEVRANLERYYGLDKSFPEQYLKYFENLLHGDLGPSYFSKSRTVNEIIADHFPVSATLGAGALGFALFFGLLLGIVAALRRNTWVDYTATGIAVFGVSIPNLVLGPILIMIFAVGLGWFPIARWDSLASIVLPTVALGMHSTAVVARLMRSNMLEVLSQDYIRTAKSKGLTNLAVVWKHTVRNAIMPIISILGPLIASLLTGTFVIEQVFAIPGLGKYFVNSVTKRDYPVIMGTTIFFGAILIIANFIVDILYSIIDPRIKIGTRED